MTRNPLTAAVCQCIYAPWESAHTRLNFWLQIQRDFFCIIVSTYNDEARRL